MQKTAVVTGLRGQDGSYLADLLLNKEYKVYGVIRRSSQGLDLGQAAHLKSAPNLEVVEGDITDSVSMNALCRLAKPDLFFNMAAQSHVGTSFKEPLHTLDVTGKGPVVCLEAIRQSGIHTRFLQASTSEMFGGVRPDPCNEDTPFYPKSPYGCAKQYAHDMVRNYREAYKMFACSSICFNHESPRRGPNFVTRKITLAVAAIKRGEQEKLYLGNLDAKRDWGHARDFVRGMYQMVTAASPRDYVLSTGETHSVREFCQFAFEYAGLGDYHKYVEIDPRFYRPTEVDVLLGDSSRILNDLGWKPEMSFADLVADMLDADISVA